MPLPNLLANKPVSYTGTSTRQKEDIDFESTSSYRDQFKQKLHSSSRRSGNQPSSYNRNNELVNLDFRNSKHIDLKLSQDLLFMSKPTGSRPSSRNSIRALNNSSVENFRNMDDNDTNFYTSRKQSGVVTRRQRIVYDKNENSESINNEELTTSTVINDDDDEEDRERNKAKEQSRADQRREKGSSRLNRNDDSEQDNRARNYFENQTPRLKSGRLTSRQLERDDSFFREPPNDRESNNSRAGNRRLASLEGGNYLNNSNLMNGFNKENRKNAVYSARSTSPTKSRRRLVGDDEKANDADQLPTLNFNSSRAPVRESSSRLRPSLLERSNNYDKQVEETPRRPSSNRTKTRTENEYDYAPSSRDRTERNLFESNDNPESSQRRPVPLPRKHLTNSHSRFDDPPESSRRQGFESFSKNSPELESQEFDSVFKSQQQQQPIIRGNSGRRYQPTTSAKSNRLLNLRQKNLESNFN